MTLIPNKIVDLKHIIRQKDYLNVYKDEINYILNDELYDEEWPLWAYDWLLDDDLVKFRNLWILVENNEQYKDTCNMPHLYVLNQYIRKGYKKKELICLTIEEYPHFLMYPRKLNITQRDLQKVIKYIQKHYNELTLLANAEISWDTYYNLVDTINENEQPHVLNEMSTILHTESGLKVDIYVDNTGSGKKSKHGGSPRLKFGIGNKPRHDDFRPMLLYPPYDTPDGIPDGISAKDVKQLRGFVEANRDMLIKLYEASEKEADEAISKFKTYMIKVNAHGTPLSKDTATGLPQFVYKRELIPNIALVTLTNYDGLNCIYKDINEIIYKDEYGKPYIFSYIGNFQKGYNDVYVTTAADIYGNMYKLYSNGEIKKAKID